MKDIKVIIVTANSQTVQQDQEAHDLADLVLMKPVTLEQIRTFATRLTK